MAEQRPLILLNGKKQQLPSGDTLSPSLLTDLPEFIDDRVAALLLAGSGITLTYDDGGNTLTIAQSFPEVFLSTTAIQSSTSTTYAAVTQLTTASLAIGTYLFDVIAICQSTATNTGLGLRIANGTATLSAAFGKWQIGQGASGTSQNFEYDQLLTTTNVSSASASAANADFLVTGKGKIVISAAGTVAVQLRSETGTSVSIRPGSVLYLKKVA